jgi:hypothetical protein
MKFIMTQTELERAVQQYVRKLIPGLDANSVIEPEFKATRGADGFTAEVDILSPEDLAEVAATKAAVPEAQPAPTKTVSATAKAAPVQPTPVPTPVAPEPVAETVEEPLSQDEGDTPSSTEESQQAESVQEESSAPATATASTKRPLFGIRQPS